MLALEQDSGVMDLKASTYNNWHQYGYSPEDDRQNLRQARVNLWHRPSLSWELICDDDLATDRQALLTGLEVKYEKPVYFWIGYTVATMAAFFEFGAMCFALLSCGEFFKKENTYCYRYVPLVVSGVAVVNILWMTWIARDQVMTQSNALGGLDMINACSDDVTYLPIEEIQDTFGDAVADANAALYLALFLTALYTVNSCMAVRNIAMRAKYGKSYYDENDGFVNDPNSHKPPTEQELLAQEMA